jgi:phosphoribosylanthranilate isomerase
MPVLVKICGLKTPETVAAALDAGADMIGLVFFARSPRNIAVPEAAALAGLARGRAEIAVLTVDADNATLDAIVAGVRPDWLQLHGRETPERVAAIRQRFGLRVMKALPVATHADLAHVTNYAGVADRLLFDAQPPRDATRPGGLGTPFDWHILEQLDPGAPFMLSGGLNAENVAEALRITRAGGVDVSSGVERAPGEKDPDKIRAFIHAARVAAAAMETASKVMSKA